MKAGWTLQSRSDKGCSGKHSSEAYQTGVFSWYQLPAARAININKLISTMRTNAMPDIIARPRNYSTDTASLER